MKFDETSFACPPREECCLCLCTEIDTCILVEIDLQVYTFSRKVGFTGPKVYFFPYFAVCWTGRVTHVGTRRFSWWRELCVFLLATQFIPIFSLAMLELQFSFNGTVVCCKKPSYFFLLFFASFKYFLYFFHLCICVWVKRKFCFSFLFITWPFLWIIIVCVFFISF